MGFCIVSERVRLISFTNIRHATNRHAQFAVCTHNHKMHLLLKNEKKRRIANSTGFIVTEMHVDEHVGKSRSSFDTSTKVFILVVSIFYFILLAPMRTKKKLIEIKTFEACLKMVVQNKAKMLVATSYILIDLFPTKRFH